MRYIQILILKKILTPLFIKKKLSSGEYLDIIKKSNNKRIEDILVDCVNKYNIGYNELPRDYQNNMSFLLMISDRERLLYDLSIHNRAMYDKFISIASDSSIKKSVNKSFFKIIKLQKQTIKAQQIF
ncbi:MAG: hypothetical protein E7351_02765 [Clostridiales bacterium]|nr:hypothetical protein [Clostridiales bacterium]